MRRIVTTALVAAVALLVAGVAKAEDKGPAGTWKWSVERNGQTRETTLKLKMEGDKLTGTVSGRNGETPIEDATCKDGEVSFKVTRERNGQKFTTSYTGKLSGDSI